MEQIIKDIIKENQNYFENSHLDFKQDRLGIFKISGDNLSIAKNTHSNTQEPIKVLNLVNDYWIYIEIRFEKFDIESMDYSKDKRRSIKGIYENNLLKINKYFYSTFITVSIFKGEPHDENKLQLFRAEWDNYINRSYHPQPHWHFHLTDKQILGENEKFDLFLKQYTEINFKQFKKYKDRFGLNISNFHFAMQAQWQIKHDNHNHSINNKSDLINWIKGLINHIKSELNYLESD